MCHLTFIEFQQLNNTLVNTKSQEENLLAANVLLKNVSYTTNIVFLQYLIYNKNK